MFRRFFYLVKQLIDDTIPNEHEFTLVLLNITIHGPEEIKKKRIKSL